MAKPRTDLFTFVGKLLAERDGDVLREGVRVLAQALMDTEVTALGCPRSALPSSLYRRADCSLASWRFAFDSLWQRA